MAARWAGVLVLGLSVLAGGCWDDGEGGQTATTESVGTPTTIDERDAVAMARLDHLGTEWSVLLVRTGEYEAAAVDVDSTLKAVERCIETDQDMCRFAPPRLVGTVRSEDPETAKLEGVALRALSGMSGRLDDCTAIPVGRDYNPVEARARLAFDQVVACVDEAREDLPLTRAEVMPYAEELRRRAGVSAEEMQAMFSWPTSP
jgi:hypothetical protein